MVKKPTAAGDAEAYERRLLSLAFSNGLLQRGEPAPPRSALAPSSAVRRLQGRDIVRRGGQRKSRFLFSFPGLLEPAASGGRAGELADLGSKNPVLYLEFPQGRMKLLGTHVYPKNKYLTLQMTRSAKGVACEDVFESLIVFSEARWIGRKEENPEELKLEFPKEFQNIVILKAEQVPPVTKQLPAIDLERKSQNPFPQISNPMVMLLRIQIIWTRMTYRLREKHLQSDSLLELGGKSLERSTSSPKGSPATKASGTRKKPKVEDDEIEQLSSSSQDNTVDDDSDEDG